MDTKLIELLYGELIVSYECSADETMKFLRFPPQLVPLLGYDAGEFGTDITLWDLVSRNELEKRQEMLVSQLDSGDIELVLPLVRKDGATEWFLNRGRKIDGTVVGILVPVGRIKDIFDHQSVELKRYKTQLEQTKSMVGTLQQRAQQDSLTKLYNADTTKFLCSEYLAGEGQTCAMIIVDLDGFKQVNDSLGHIEGNHVLTQVAEKIRKLFRSGDIVGRIGGDEFLILMKDIQTPAIVDKKCAALVEAISSGIDAAKDVDFGCSAGVVVARTGAVRYEELFCCADRAMYSVKNSGGKNYSIMQHQADALVAESF